jgi:hypothetical protein
MRLGRQPAFGMRTAMAIRSGHEVVAVGGVVVPA